MAALRLVRRWGVPLATAAGVPMLVPVVRAEAGDAKEEAPASPPPPPPTSRMVRPSDLPIYEEPEDVLDFEYHGRERTALEEGVGVVRQQVEGVLEATRSTRERAVHIYETGKAHSMATVDYLTDEENMLPRAGAITVGGLAGLVLGARKRGGFFKKVLYTSTGVITAASLCYPRHAYAISQQLYSGAKTYGAIGYNFVAGVKPQSKTPPPPPPAPAPVETPKEAEKEEEASASASADTAKPEGAEVRSAVVLSLPPGKTLVDTLAEQASDVTVWGFRLTDNSTAPPKPPVPEGFGSIDTAQVVAGQVQGEAEAPQEVVEGVKEVMEGAKEGTAVVEEKLSEVEKVVEEGVVAAVEKLGELEEVVEVVKEGAAVVKEKLSEVEEKVEKVMEVVEEGVAAMAEKVSEVEGAASSAAVEVLTPVLGKEEAQEVVEKVEEVVGEAVEEVVEAAAVVVEEHVAPVVEEAASLVEEGAAVVGKVTEVVQEVGQKVEEALSVVERVGSAAEAATEVFPGVPEAAVEKVEAVVEETQAVVESVTTTSREVEGVAEEVKEEAHKVEEEAAQVMESEEKRKEVAEELVELVEAKEQQVVEEQADVIPASTPPVTAPPREEVEGARLGHTKEREGLFDKLVTFLSRPSKDARDSARQEETAAVGVAEEKTDHEVASGVPQSPVLVEEKPQSGTGDHTLTEGSVEVVEATSMVEVVKEGAAAVGEKLGEVEEKVVEVVEEGVAAVVEKVSEVEEAASIAAVEVLTPVLGKEEAWEVVEKVEEAVEGAAVVVEEHVAPVMEEAAGLVEKVVEETQAVVESISETAREVEGVVEQVTQVVEGKEGELDTGPAAPLSPPAGEREGLVNKLVNLLSKPSKDTTQSAKAAVEGTPEVPDSAREVKAAPQFVGEAMQSGKEVKGVAEEVKEDMQKVEEEAIQVVESKVVDLPEPKEQPVVKEQVESTPATTPEGQPEVEATPAAPLVPQVEEREGLLDKLVSLFSKDTRQEEAAPHPVSEATDTAREVEAVPEVVAEVPHSAKEVQETQVDTTPPATPAPSTEADTAPPTPVQEAATEADTAPPTPVQEAAAEADTASSTPVQEAATPAAQPTPVEEIATLAAPPTPVQEAATETDAAPAAPLVPQAEEREGLFDKLISFLSKDSKDTTAAEVPDNAKQVEAAGETVSEVAESAKEDQGAGEGEGEFVIVSSMGEATNVMDVLKPDSVLDKLRPTESLQENMPAEAEVTPVTPEATRTAEEKEQVVEEVPGLEAETKGEEVQVTEEEGLFDKLVRLFTKDDERLASSSATVPSLESAAAAAGSAEPVPGEGEEAALSAAPGDMDTTQGLGVPVVPEQAAQIPDVLKVPSDTPQVPDALPAPQDTAQGPQDTAQGPDIPASTAGTEQGETEGTLLEEPTSESPAPPPVKKKALLDKLSSLFQKEEPQPSDAPVAETQESPAKQEEDMSGSAVQEASPAAGDSATAPPPSPPEGGSGSGEGEAADSVAAAGGKEEEEAALPAAEETAAAQPQVSATQVQSSSVVGAVEVSGEAAKGETAAIPSMSQGVQGQAESREASTQTHSVVPVAVTQPTTDSATVSPGEVSRPPDGPVSITSEEDTFIVRASPNRPSETEAQGDHGRPGGKAGAVVRPRWSATEAVVVEEGKDVIVQLTPQGPEKDYGQSSPEDSDMYTTRG
ncbi:hypothetical protein O3P69_005632 [Scylla paramamosain]|uniref:MICOS complex subunit n=1 Tax=Scylla paramamosain TaxID=85552 RepID=A0AAW0UAA2_SCYPA